MSIQVSFSENVNVVGTPTLALNTGANVSYSTGSGGSTLNFTYTVAAGQSAADLDYTSTSALTAGTSIRDAAVNDANRTLATPGQPGSLGNAMNIVVVPAKTWTGAVSTAWATAGNWSLPNAVPGTTDDVVIGSGTNQPTYSTGTTTVRNITVNNGGTLTVSGGTLNVTYNTTGGILTINNGGAVVASGGALNLNGGGGSGQGGIVTISSGGSLTISGGAVDSDGGYSTATAEFNNDGQLTISSGSLTIEEEFGGSGDTDMSGGNLTVGGGWTATSTADFDATGGTTTFANLGSWGTGNFASTTGKFQFFNLTINSGVTAGFDDVNNSAILIAGTFTNNGTADFNTGTNTTTVTFNGTGAQSIAGATVFRNVNVNKASGSLTLSANATVGTTTAGTGTLTLTQGNVTTGSNFLIIASGGSVSRPAGTPGHVVGNLRKSISSGAPSRTFEVGTASDYAPVDVTFVGVGTAGTLTVSTTAGDHPSIGTSGIDSTLSVNRYWTFTNASTTFTSYGATFSYPATDVDAGANPAAFIVKRFASAAWNTTTLVGTPTSTSAQISGVTGVDLVR